MPATWRPCSATWCVAIPEREDRLAVLVFETIAAIEQKRRPEGVDRAVNTLKLIMEWILTHASAREYCFKPFLYHLEGLLNHGDLPAELIGGAIERADPAEACFTARMKKKDATPEQSKNSEN